MGCKESTTQYFKLKTWPTFLLSSVYLLLFYKKKKKNPIWYFVIWLITIIFTDAQCVQKLHTPYMYTDAHIHLDLNLAEQTSHVVQLQLRKQISSTKHYHWQPKGLWKPPLADPSSV